MKITTHIRGFHVLGLAITASLWTGCASHSQEDGRFRIAASTHYASADMLERQNNLPGALKQYEEVIATDPQMTSAYHGLGRVHFRLGRYDDAENAFTRGIERAREVPSLHNNLGYTCLQERKFAEAESCFRHALELSPSFQRARMNLGVALARQDRVDDSIQEFAKVLPREDAYFNAAVIRAEENDFDGAAKALRGALALNPDYQPALDHLDRIARIARAESDAKAALSRLAARNAVASFSEPVGSASTVHRPSCVVSDQSQIDVRFNDSVILADEASSWRTREADRPGQSEALKDQSNAAPKDGTAVADAVKREVKSTPNDEPVNTPVMTEIVRVYPADFVGPPAQGFELPETVSTIDATRTAEAPPSIVSRRFPPLRKGAPAGAKDGDQSKPVIRPAFSSGANHQSASASEDLRDD